MSRFDNTDINFVEDLIAATRNFIPDIILKKHKVDEKANVDDIIKKKQSIIITRDRYPEIFEVFPKNIKNKLDSKEIDDSIKYENMESFIENEKIYKGYNLIEYHGTYDYWFITGCFIYLMNKFNPDSFYMNFYNIENMKNNIFSKILMKEPADIPRFKYLDNLKSLDINYSVFKEKAYRITDCQNISVYCLFLNLPYDFYKNLKDMDYDIYYDFQEKEFCLSGTRYVDYIDLINDIAENGIRNPLYMKIKNGNIVDLQSSHGKLMIAKMLQLPSIPVCLYFTANQTAPYENLFLDNRNKDIINNICDPYFKFEQ